MMTASVASQLMSTCGQGPGLDKMAKDSDFFLRMVAIRIPSLSGPGSAGPRRLQGQRKAQHCQDSKNIKDIHRVKAPLFQPAVERRGAEQLPPPAGGFPDDDLQSHHAAFQPVGQSQRERQPRPADAQRHTAQRTG